MDTTPNYHVLIVKCIGQTNTEPKKTKIISERFKQSITIPYDWDKRDAIEGATEYMTNIGWEIIGVGEGKGHMYLITNTFKPLK